MKLFTATHAGHHFLHHFFIALLIFLSLALSGCQLLPGTIEAEPQPLVTKTKANNIPSHEFQIKTRQNIIGALASIETREHDTLSDIGRHFGLGYNDVTRANPELKPWSLKNGQTAILPLRFILPETPHKGIVLNLANMRLFYYPENQPETVFTYPAGIGRQGWNTPLGLTQITAKKAYPDWVVPESILREHEKLGDPLPKLVHAGPDNPLGNFAMPLGKNGYLIHGTNKPYGIGMQVSHGCVQMYPEDIESLFGKVAVGTSVNIIHQPYLLAWEDNSLYLEAHQPLEKWGNQLNQLQKELRNRLKKMAAEKNLNIDWPKVEQLLQRSDGIPAPVQIQSPDLPVLQANATPVQHPEQFYGQPIAGDLTDSDWSILAASFKRETDAQTLAAMLNHQGPPIPARMIANNGEYQVLAGPFRNRQETKIYAKRIKQNFDITATTLAPKTAIKK